MSGARALLLALLLARLLARLRGPGPARAAPAELAAGAARRAAPRSQDAASGRSAAAAAAAPGCGAQLPGAQLPGAQLPGAQLPAAQLPAAGPRRGRPAPPLRRRPRAARAALRRPDRHRPPGVSGLRGPAASRRSGGSRSVSQVCVEKSLVFRSNTPYATDIVAVPGGRDLLFCVQLDDSKLNYFQQPQDIKESDFVEFLEKYGRHSFLAPSQVQPSFSAFYRAGDPILIYFDSSSVLSTLRQPVKMGASGLCVDGNPAGFLDSKSTSCTRIFANLSKSCVTDPALAAASYYRDFSVLKVPINDTIVQSMKVKVTAVAAPGAPHMKDNTCHNVVSQVIYEIEFSSTRGIQSVSVRFEVSSVSGSAGSALQQRFTFRFWTRTLSHTLPRSGNPGYIPEAPLLTAHGGATQHMSVLQSEGDGSCSRFLRHTVQFGRNMRTGCKLSLSQMPEGDNCGHARQQLQRALRGPRGADVAVTGSAGSSQAEQWAPILSRNCSVQAVNCTSCCMVPVTLEIQILWTKVGLLSNPQAQILGARYLYQCQPLKVWNPNLLPVTEFLSTSAVPLAAVVTFMDVTEWPEPPRGQPQVHWKLPFDIFFPFKVAANFERSYRGDLAACFLLLLVLSSILCF